MMGWRARLGFLVPPGNPTVELEMMQLAPPGVSLHFSRLSATGPTGTLTRQKERNRSYSLWPTVFSSPTRPSSVLSAMGYRNRSLCPDPGLAEQSIQCQQTP